MSTPTPNIEDLQDRWPVFSTILLDYYVARPGAAKGRKGDEATFLTRFGSTGGEDNPEFTGLRAELVDMTRKSGAAATLINVMFGHTNADGTVNEDDPNYVDRIKARTLITGLMDALYTTNPDEAADAEDADETSGYVGARVEAFDAYRKHVLFHLPANLKGTIPTWFGPRLGGGQPLAGYPAPAPLVALVGVVLATIGMGINLGLTRLGASRSIVLPVSWPFLLAGAGLVLWAVLTMLLIRSAVLHPEDEDRDGVDDDIEGARAQEQARRNVLRNLRNR